MKLAQAVLASTPALIANAGLAADPSNAELKDFLAYFKSVRMPTVLEACAPVAPDKDSTEATAKDWLQANAQAVDRGKRIALANSPSAQSLDENNAAMLAGLKEELAQYDDAKKKKFCVDELGSYKLPAQKN